MREKYTLEGFIERARETHGDTYDYSITEYINCKDKVKIICPIHGVFELIADNHVRRDGCSMCNYKNRLENNKANFIQKANKIHNNIFDYSKVNYINNHTKVIITCKNHGDFIQSPQHHLIANGCNKCKEIKKKNSSYKFEKFKQEANIIHDGKYEYIKEDFTTLSNSITLSCKEHGDFTIIPYKHLKGSGCKICSNINSGLAIRSNTEDFIKKCKEVHGDTYDYSSVNYIHSREDVDIICNIHGIFKQKPTTHLKGCGCQKCAILINVYKKEDYIKLSPTATIYLVMMEYENEKFLKIGKTKNTVKDRLNNNTGKYKYSILFEKVDKSSIIFDLEIELHKYFNSFKYTPLHKFPGRTECYNLNLSIEEIINFIKSYGR